jgi:hypothetical protein
MRSRAFARTGICGFYLLRHELPAREYPRVVTGSMEEHRLLTLRLRFIRLDLITHILR